MKKLFVVALAALGMVACVNEDVVETPKSDAIAFAGASIDNATRAAEDPSFDQVKGNLNAFNVWAFMTTTNGPVFEGEEVTKNGNVWGYGDTQYWAPEKDYYFAALAPMNSANWQVEPAVSPKAEAGLGTVTFTNVNGTEDLIYAKKALTTPTMSDLLAEGMEPVKLNFQHLLSKVKFTFKNGFATDNAYVEVKNVTMSAPKKANIDLAVADYTEGWVIEENDALAFGDVQKLDAPVKEGGVSEAEAAYERLTIPADADYEYTIEFDIVLYMGTEVAYEVHRVSVVSGVAFEMGHAYNLVAEITPENLQLLPIVFEVENVDGWVEDPSYNYDYDYDVLTGVAYVNTLTGLRAVAAGINAGEIPANVNILMTSDLDLAEVQNRAIVANWEPIGTGAANPFTGTFDGNGYTIKNFEYTVTGEDEAWYVGLFGYAKDATIKNLVMENVTITSEQAYFAEVGAVVGHLEGNSTLENITIKGDVKIAGNVENVEASRIGGVVGGNAAGTITVKNVHVVANAGSYVKGGSHVGGIAGQLQRTNNFENCSTNIDVTAGQYFAGGIIGCGGQKDTYTNCHTTGNVAVVAGRAANANDLYRVGGIAGGWGDAKGRVLTLANCTYAGTVSGQDAAGVVAETLDCAGYVGRGYAAATGAKVVVNGVTFTYNGNGQSSQDGALVSNDEELAAALAGNYSVITLAAGEYGAVVAKSNVTLNGMPGAKVASIDMNGAANLTIKNIEFDAANAGIACDGTGKGLRYANIYSGGANKPIIGVRNVVIDGCTFTGAFSSTYYGCAIAFTDQKRSSGGSGDITIKNCVFDQEWSAYDIYTYYAGYGSMLIENNTFKGSYVGGPIYLGKYQSSVPVVVKNNVFETVTSQANAMYIQDHSNYGVSINAENNTYAE